MVRAIMQQNLLWDQQSAKRAYTEHAHGQSLRVYVQAQQNEHTCHYSRNGFNIHGILQEGKIQ